MGDHWNDPNPHDGRHGRCNCGQGVSRDNQDYRIGRRLGAGGNGSGCGFILLIIVGSAIGAFNELLGALIIVIGSIFLLIGG